MDDEHAVIVPVLSEELTVLAFVVPKDFAMTFELRASQIIESFDRHPADSQMDKNNKLMQAMSFLVQTSFEFYEEHIDEPDCLPPDINDV
jgi:hypothetical protein|tara:strand:- start:408 stop:677 length:270 start_codon:yes stop_codon:yes gene_type:complete